MVDYHCKQPESPRPLGSRLSPLATEVLALLEPRLTRGSTAALLVAPVGRSCGACRARLRREGGRHCRPPITWRRSRHAGRPFLSHPRRLSSRPVSAVGHSRPGGTERGDRLNEPRRSKHCSDRRERSAWFERPKVSRHPDNLRLSGDSESREFSRLGLSGRSRGMSFGCSKWGPPTTPSHTYHFNLVCLT